MQGLGYLKAEKRQHSGCWSSDALSALTSEASNANLFQESC